MTDKDMIALLQEKNEQGFALMMERYCNYVAAIVSNLARGTLPVEDLEEICADVFIAVWNGSHRIQGESIRPYIAQVARNTVFSRLRKKGGGTVPLDDDMIVVELGGQPDELAIQREQSGIINHAVAAMGGDEREIFVRYYFFGEPLGAVAKRMGILDSTVRSKLHRCRKKLKAVLQQRGYGYEE